MSSYSSPIVISSTGESVEEGNGVSIAYNEDYIDVDSDGSISIEPESEESSDDMSID